jgi:hypothetical protein
MGRTIVVFGHLMTAETKIANGLYTVAVQVRDIRHRKPPKVAKAPAA